MPEIITFMSPKGGSGATFVCAGVWATLCEKSYKVLAFDACFEKGALDYALGFKSDYVYTMTDVADGNCSLKDAMVIFGSGSFLRADYENNFFETEDAFEILNKTDFDYILVDLNDRNEDFVNEVLKKTHKLILVADPGILSCKCCEMAVDKFEFENTFVLVNKIIPTYIKAGVHCTVDDIIDAVSSPLMGLVPWSPGAEIIMRQGIKNGICDNELKTTFSNVADRICGVQKKAYDFRKVYDCFKLGKNFSVKSD